MPTEQTILRNSLRRIADPGLRAVASRRITPAMTVSALRDVADTLGRRLEAAHGAFDRDEPLYANLHTVRLREIADALTQKYTRTPSLTEKSQILALLNDIQSTLEGSGL